MLLTILFGGNRALARLEINIAMTSPNFIDEIAARWHACHLFAHPEAALQAIAQADGLVVRDVAALITMVDER